MRHAQVLHKNTRKSSTHAKINTLLTRSREPPLFIDTHSRERSSYPQQACHMLDLTAALQLETLQHRYFFPTDTLSQHFFASTAPLFSLTKFQSSIGLRPKTGTRTRCTIPKNFGCQWRLHGFLEY